MSTPTTSSPSSSTSPPLPEWKTNLITSALTSNILTFGTYTLKSGRQSPYFFNCGGFSHGTLIPTLTAAYAQTLHSHATTRADGPAPFAYDVIFGPAYKGIPLAALAALKLIETDPVRYADLGYAFNRKEAKDHGEGGVIVGESLRGKRVVIIDDVITAGTAIREAVQVIEREGGVLAGIVVAIDRQERLPGTEAGGESAIGTVRRETGVPVLAVLTLGDVIEGLRKMGKEDEVKRMEEYRKEYGAAE